MDRIHRQEQEATFFTGAKAVSLMFIAGVIMLLAAHTTEMPGGGTVASASAISLEPTREMPEIGVDVPDGYKLPGQEAAEAAARVADDPPIATCGIAGRPRAVEADETYFASTCVPISQ
jgi:hypothetical protein